MEARHFPDPQELSVVSYIFEGGVFVGSEAYEAWMSEADSVLLGYLFQKAPFEGVDRFLAAERHHHLFFRVQGFGSRKSLARNRLGSSFSVGK